MSYGQGQSTRGNPLRHETVTAHRQVFPTGEIPHKWAHATQEAARNAQGNLYFKGPTIYSYRDSWPLARIYKRKIKGALFEKDNPACNLVLTNSERASNTTAKHQYMVNQAVRHLPSIAVPYVQVQTGMERSDKVDHERNLKYLTDAAAEHLKKAQRALSTAQASWRCNAARQAIDDAAAYMAFFGIRRKAPVLPTAEWDATLARAQRIENPDPLSVDKRERASAQRKARLSERDEYLLEQRRNLARGAFYMENARRTDWRLFGAFGACLTSYGHTARGAVMLRVNDDEIETSQGARIPADHAPRIWSVVQKVMARGEPYQHNGHSEHAGDFRIDRIEVDGTLKAGCHTISYGELRAMARQLGLEVQS